MAFAAQCNGDSACEHRQLLTVFKLTDVNAFRTNYDQYGQLYAEINRTPYFLKGKTLERVMAAWIYSFRSDYLYLRPAYNQFVARFPTSTYKPLLDQVLQPFFTFEKQAIHPDQIRFTPHPERITNLDDLLKSHRGRVVYVDFWGTWCAPFRTEMPYTKQLKDKLKDQPVDFLYIAEENGTDQARINRWKATIQRLRITGEHFMMTPAFIAGMKQLNQEVTQYPTYALFDKTGKLVNFGAARPSETDAVMRQIQDALK